MVVFPNFRGENKNLWNHQLDALLREDPSNVPFILAIKVGGPHLMTRLSNHLTIPTPQLPFKKKHDSTFLVAGFNHPSEKSSKGVHLPEKVRGEHQKMSFETTQFPTVRCCRTLVANDPSGWMPKTKRGAFWSGCEASPPIAALRKNTTFPGMIEYELAYLVAHGSY